MRNKKITPAGASWKIYTVCLFCLVLLALALPLSLRVSAAQGNEPARGSWWDPVYSTDYLAQINAAELHEMGITGKYADGTPVRVVVIDSGIDITNAAFGDADGNCLISPLSYNASAKKTVAEYGLAVVDDQSGTGNHGTAVCGTIVSQLTDCRGVAPDAELVIIRVNYSFLSGGYATEDLLEALRYAVSLHPAVISCSWSISSRDEQMDEFVAVTQQALDEDILVLFSAGNDSSAVDAPANLDTVVCIGAVDGDNDLTHYSNFGKEQVLVAPGNVTCVEYGGGLRQEKGTSFACPITAGVAALYRSTHPDATVAQTVEALTATARDLGNIGWDRYYGYGLVDAYAACTAQSVTVSLVTDATGAAGTTTTDITYYPTHQTLTLPTPTSIGNGALFAGWYTSPDRIGTTPIVPADVTQDMTLYAGWQYSCRLYEGDTLVDETAYFPGETIVYPTRIGFALSPDVPQTMPASGTDVYLDRQLVNLETTQSLTSIVHEYVGREPVVLSVDVSHALQQAITYQWYKDGEAIAMATASTLPLTGKASDRGTYTCAVSLTQEGQTKAMTFSFTVRTHNVGLAVTLSVIVVLIAGTTAAVLQKRRKNAAAQAAYAAEQKRLYNRTDKKRNKKPNPYRHKK